jgi:prepilin-type processing-associated H-X9-DG protein
MNDKTKFTKKEIVIVFGCVIFLLLNIGAIGSSGRNRAKEMVCLSNLHQWGIMFDMYAKDYNGRFMQGFTAIPRANRWISALGDYYKWDDKITCCPTAAKPWVDEYGNISGAGGTESGVFMAWGYLMQAHWSRPMKGSYGINGWCIDPQQGHEPYRERGNPDYFWRGPSVSGAENVPLFLEAQRYNGVPLHTDMPPAYSGEQWINEVQMGQYCLNRHNGTAGCLFLDFSVRKVGLKDLWTLKWHRNYQTEGLWTIAGGVQPTDWPEWMKNFKDY